MIKSKKITVIDEVELRRADKVEAIAQFIMDLGESTSKKNRDYDDDNVRTLGQKGIYVRMSDKLTRLKTWMWYDVPYMNDETFQDTLMDLAKYCLIASLVERGKW